MSTNYYHFLAQGELNPFLHVGKFSGLGRYCCLCHTKVGASPECPNCHNSNKDDMKGEVAFIWAMKPSLFALHCLHGTVWADEYGQKISSEDLATKINEALEQDYSSIGAEFS